MFSFQILFSHPTWKLFQMNTTCLKHSQNCMVLFSRKTSFRYRKKVPNIFFSHEGYEWKTFLGKTTDKHGIRKKRRDIKKATTNTLSINKNIKGEFSISFFSFPPNCTHTWCSKGEMVKKRRKYSEEDKNGRFPRCIFLQHLIWFFLLNVLARASCLYDMIPFLFPLPDRMARAYNISQYIHARCACKRALNEMLNGKIFYCVFHPADFEKCTQLFFLVCTYSVCEGEKKQKK
jgi:hypothetical protein